MMAVQHRIALILCVVATIDNHIGLVGASNIGVCYGMLGNDLPAATEVVNLYKKYNIFKMRLFDPNHAAPIEALRGIGIHVTLGIRNKDLADLARCEDAVDTWFNNNLAPYLHDINYFAYKSDPAHVPLDYAQFTSQKPAVVRDGNFNYFYLFGATVDAFLAGNGHVRVVVSETYNRNAMCLECFSVSVPDIVMLDQYFMLIKSRYKYPYYSN